MDGFNCFSYVCGLMGDNVNSCWLSDVGVCWAFNPGVVSSSGVGFKAVAC
jgi:hypothetical protein